MSLEGTLAMIHVIATITLKPDTRPAFLDVFRWLTPLVQAESGCIEYQGTIDIPTTSAVQEGPSDDVVTVVEKWDSLDALYAHTQAPHMTQYREKVKDFVLGVTLKVTKSI
jgi:quinol monooxygenase YgiN